MIFDKPQVQMMPLRPFAGPVQRYDMQTRARIPARLWRGHRSTRL